MDATVVAIRHLAAVLPRRDRVEVERALARIRGQVGVGEEPEVEWDLRLANTLDELYSAVAERVKELAESGEIVVERAGKAVATAVMPTGVVVVAVLLAWALARRG